VQGNLLPVYEEYDRALARRRTAGQKRARRNVRNRGRRTELATLPGRAWHGSCPPGAGADKVGKGGPIRAERGRREGRNHGRWRRRGREAARGAADETSVPDR